MGVTVCLNMLTKQPFFSSIVSQWKMTLLKIVYLLLNSLLFLHSFSWFCHFSNGFMTTYGTNSVEKQMIYLECNKLCVTLMTHEWWTFAMNTRVVWGSFFARKSNIFFKKKRRTHNHWGHSHRIFVPRAEEINGNILMKLL